MRYIVKFVSTTGGWSENLYDSLSDAFAEGKKIFIELNCYAFAVVEDTNWNVHAVIVPTVYGGAIIAAITEGDNANYTTDFYVEKLWGSETTYEEYNKNHADDTLREIKKNPDVEFALIFNYSNGIFKGFRKVNYRDQPRLVYIEP